MKVIYITFNDIVIDQLLDNFDTLFGNLFQGRETMPLAVL